jgi:hypothetical protein
LIISSSLWSLLVVLIKSGAPRTVTLSLYNVTQLLAGASTLRMDAKLKVPELPDQSSPAPLNPNAECAVFVLLLLVI